MVEERCPNVRVICICMRDDHVYRREQSLCGGGAPSGHGLRCAYAIFHFHSHISQTKIFIYEIDYHYAHVVSGRSDSLCAGNYPQTGSN